MCVKDFSSKIWKTPCGKLKAATIIKIIKTIIRIIQAVISRCLFVLYTFIAVWRVTEALQNDNYWLLLLTLVPLALETVHSVFVRKGNEMKWITPSVLFYLLCGIPCIWLLELKLLDSRLGVNTTTGTNNTSSLSQSVSGVISINLSDETWTLALEQILIFVLVLAKWIAPKGEMSLDELSQLLLVNIAAGADIIELMEVFGDDQVSQNTEIVYMIMSVWTWSLLQFAVVLTASKNLPNLYDDDDEEIIKTDKYSTLSKREIEGKANGNHKESMKRQPNGKERDSNANNEKENNAKNEKSIEDAANGDKPSSPKEEKNQAENKEMQIIEIDDEVRDVGKTEDMKKIHDKLRTEEEVTACLQGRRCFECFCCYNEIWGLLMSIFFQDGPFFVIRMVILLHYNVVTHMNIFFTCKNVFVILLLFNRIRVIVSQEKQPWLNYMAEVKAKRRHEKDEARRNLGLPPKTKERPRKDKIRKRKPTKKEQAQGESRSQTPKPPKPRWVIWRA